MDIRLVGGLACWEGDKGVIPTVWSFRIDSFIPGRARAGRGPPGPALWGLGP